MPLTPKGKKVEGKLTAEYGPKKGKNVFYALIQSGKLKGAEGKKK